MRIIRIVKHDSYFKLITDISLERKQTVCLYFSVSKTTYWKINNQKFGEKEVKGSSFQAEEVVCGVGWGFN